MAALERTAGIAARIATLILAFPFAPVAQAQPSGVAAVEPGIYVLSGDNGEVMRDNRGEVANTGFIVGNDAVLAIDSGISATYGERMLAVIAATTPKPIRNVVLTHPVQEFIFGATAFQRRGIPVIAQRRAAELIQQRCAHCLKDLLKLLGSDLMRATAVVQVDRKIDGSITLDLGNRIVDLLGFDQASAPGDLAVFDRRSGTLYAGGLVTAGRIPNLRDGDIRSWIAALDSLRRLPRLRHVVPGFGPAGDRAEIDRMRDYLRLLDEQVSQRYRDGDSLIEAMRSVDLPAFRKWQGYESTHPQNVQYRYQQLEAAEFRRPAVAP